MKKITYLTLILCAFAALSGCRKKDEYYSNERPISEYKAVDVTTFSDIELITANVEDMNKDNAMDIITSYYGLELTIPDA
ncbi:MAG: hypothetical protein MJ246_04280 [Clostridia bacterium]|nr:hypothetical protein [Clostridia bacterium]